MNETTCPLCGSKMTIIKSVSPTWNRVSCQAQHCDITFFFKDLSKIASAIALAVAESEHAEVATTYRDRQDLLDAKLRLKHARENTIENFRRK